MDFASLTFAGFTVVALAIYLVLPLKLRIYWLLAASGYFYVSLCRVEWLALPLAISLGTEYFSAQRIAAAGDRAIKRRWLGLSIVIELGMLVYFRAQVLFSPELGIVGPLGLSFFVFQCLSYTIDVYRGHASPVTRFTDLAFLVAVFFKVGAGPIERAKRFLPQIAGPTKLSFRKCLSGLQLVLLGAYKKIAIADQLYPVARRLAPSEGVVEIARLGGLDIVAGATLATMALYAEFSGYTDTMRGVAKLFGFELTPNFHAPFLARNVQQYWTRWHVTLTNWIFDYWYVPVARSVSGRRLGPPGIALLTMVVMGLWHGFAVNFVLWGLWHGVLLALYSMLRPHLERVIRPRTALVRSLVSCSSILLTFACTVLGTVVFCASHPSTIVQEFERILLHPALGASTPTLCAPCLLYYTPLAVLDAIEEIKGQHDVLDTLAWPWRSSLLTVMGVLVLSLWLAGAESTPFRYF